MPVRPQSQPLPNLPLLSLLLMPLLIVLTRQCAHDDMITNITFHYYNDLTEELIEEEIGDERGGGHWARVFGRKRLLQDLTATSTSTTTTTTSTITSTSTSTTTTTTADKTVPRNKLRVYVDYRQLLVGDIASQNVIKRVMNISSNFFYNTLNVDRLDRLYFPPNSPLQCSILAVPPQYVTTGVIGDIGILVSNQDNTATYVARSMACSLLKSNNRPIWGVVVFNNRNLGYGQIQFQKIVSVALHELTHVLGFSSALYSLFPSGNPFITVNNTQYLTSPKILSELSTHFNCPTPIGLPLQDQDGTINSSHQQRKILGNQYMIAINKKQAFVSRFTLAVLDSTGWYDVNYGYAEPTGWGKGRGCDFLNVDDCGGEEFCGKVASSASLELNCDWDGTAYGSCLNDPFTNSCNMISYYTNTICLQQSYQLTSLTSQLKSKQKGGYNSRCYNSTFRTAGIAPNIINYRCYVTICSSILYVKVDTYILLCKFGGQEIVAPGGMEGILRCPSFRSYCVENKRTCAYHCNKNGICINGMCLCTGSTVLTTTCLDQSNLTTTIPNTAGLLNSILHDNGDILTLLNTPKSPKSISYSLRQKQGTGTGTGRNTNKKQLIATKRSINIQCIQGTFFDSEFSECVKCRERFGGTCEECGEAGCLGK